LAKIDEKDKKEFLLKPLTLLYIEDDIDIQEIYIEFLNDYVETVYLANDGESGYELYLLHKPDIILLDINMPKLDGLSLAEKIRKSDKDVQIIITTAYGEQENLLKAIELYLVKYILKPIDFNELEEALNKAIIELKTINNREAEEEIFCLDENTLWHRDTEKLYTNNSEVKLTKNERRLLALVSSNENKIFTFYDIFNHIAQDNFNKEYDANQVRALVKLLRKKIPKESIINIYGEGYRFNPIECEDAD
jgi:DNA-binding response OmpR family regulator